MLSRFLLLAYIPCLVSSWLWPSSPQPQWNDLRVKWGMNFFSSAYFTRQPRTAWAAEAAGFVKISDCDANGVFRGNRYVKNGDYALILLYDVNGFIAGIQAGISKERTDGYPYTELRSVFIEDGDHYFITAYFVDPAIICTTGRTQQMFDEDGTGTNLTIQHSRVPTRNNMLIPFHQEDVTGTMWTEGKCFWSMGKHYWYNLRRDMTKEEFFPVFLLYNRGELTGFGWAFLANLDSSRYEHPNKRVFSLFMREVPDFVDNIGTVSTMHIFLTHNPRTGNRC